MSFSLYSAVVPSYLQILRAVSSLLDVANRFCEDSGISENELVQARFANGMLPFAYQVKSTAVHSLGAIEGVRRGVFSPDLTAPPGTLLELNQRIETTITELAGIQPSEVDGFVGRDMRFAFGDQHVDFFAEEFLLSFSQPNFYFHATTAYDLLRWKGVQIGKRDFAGLLRTKQSARIE